MDDPGDDVIIECFGVQAVRASPDGALSLFGRHVQSPRNHHHPDVDAAKLIGLFGSPLDGVALLHSTSWRFDPTKGVILTYVCCPDPTPNASGVLIAAASGHASGREENPSRPHDPDADLSDVLHHGVDHLAWLDDHHRHLTTSTSTVAPEIWDAIRLAGRHRAGQRSSSVQKLSAEQ